MVARLFFRNRLMFVLLAVFGFACNQTTPHGKILVPQKKNFVGDSIQLILQPDLGSENLFGVYWMAQPSDKCLILWNRNENMDKAFTKDRIAVFIPHEKGEFLVSVHAFLNQTNPNFVTNIKIYVDSNEDKHTN